MSTNLIRINAQALVTANILKQVVLARANVQALIDATGLGYNQQKISRVSLQALVGMYQFDKAEVSSTYIQALLEVPTRRVVLNSNYPQFLVESTKSSISNIYIQYLTTANTGQMSKLDSQILVDFQKPLDALSVGDTQVPTLFSSSFTPINGVVSYLSSDSWHLGTNLVSVNDGNFSIHASAKYRINNVDLSYSDVGAAPLVHTHTASDIVADILSIDRLGSKVEDVDDTLLFLHSDSTWKQLPADPVDTINITVNSLGNSEVGTTTDTLDASAYHAGHWHYTIASFDGLSLTTGYLMGTWNLVREVINYSVVTATSVGNSVFTPSLKFGESYTTIHFVVNTTETRFSVKLKRIVL